MRSRARRRGDDRTGRGRFLFGQRCEGQFHRVVNRDSRDPFVLVDPAIAGQRGQVFFLRGFQFFGANFGAFLFVGVSARRRLHRHKREHAEEGEEQNNPHPRREHRARLIILEWFRLRHC